MSEIKTYTLNEAHKQFAITTNGLVWQLLEKKDRNKSDEELMIHAAHTSCYHWLQVGTGLHHQRAEWLLSHVYAEIGFSTAALKHAKRCQDLTEEYIELMQDFDIAYAHESLARANALSGKVDESMMYIRKAEMSGQAIAKDEDRNIFFTDFNGGNWYGIR
ncbi:MAG: hypothetical protein IH585_01600 [Anaerolineaceae bacterium]|nr:hypothetical protein [Anaerolineaceae bacterium]